MVVGFHFFVVFVSVLVTLQNCVYLVLLHLVYLFVLVKRLLL